MEEIEQMNNLFQQKQRELVMAASKVEDLNRQLELLKNGKMDNFHDNQSSVAELDRLYKELQVCRNKILLQRQYLFEISTNVEPSLLFVRVSRPSLWSAEKQAQPGSKL